MASNTLGSSTLTVKNITLPARLKAGDNIWRIWIMRNTYVYPLYLEPLPSGQSLVGWTDTTSVGHVSLLDDLESTIIWTRDFPGRIVRGIATTPDTPNGRFSVLLWDGVNRIWVRMVNSDGSTLWETELVVTSPWISKPTDFEIGDSNLSGGGVGTNARIGAYYHVHSDSGHEGDALFYLNATSGATLPGGWGWGCSHSMSHLLRFYSSNATSIPPSVAVCVSDCYPSKSISIFNGRYTLQSISGNCLGGTGAELGSIVATGNSSLSGLWHVVAASQVDAAGGNAPTQLEISYSVLNVTNSAPVAPLKWLTTPASDSSWKTDPSIATWKNGTLLVGWAIDPLGGRVTTQWRGLSNNLTYQLAVLSGDGKGSLLEGPITLPKGIYWGRRNDPFRNTLDGSGSIMWVFGDPNSTTLKVARLSPPAVNIGNTGSNNNQGNSTNSSSSTNTTNGITYTFIPDTSSPKPTPSSTLSTGAIGGIAAGSVALCALATGLFFIMRRRGTRIGQAKKDVSSSQAQMLNGSQIELVVSGKGESKPPQERNTFQTKVSNLRNLIK